MIAKRDIFNLLSELENYYNSEPPPKSTYYSKLAVIELCGWIEESFDKIAMRCVKNQIKTSNYSDIMDSIVLNNYGFSYKRNFRKMMLQTIGIKKMEELEVRLRQSGQLPIINSILENLTTERNNAAHTTIVGVMRTFQAPSITIRQLEDIYPIIRKMYSFAVNDIK